MKSKEQKRTEALLREVEYTLEHTRFGLDKKAEAHYQPMINLAETLKFAFVPSTPNKQQFSIGSLIEFRAIIYRRLRAKHWR